jgi:N-acyl homoserine lactone hydrolase
MTIPRELLAIVGLGLVVTACTPVMRDDKGQHGIATVERMYVIECGENHAKDLSSWTTVADKEGDWRSA